MHADCCIVYVLISKFLFFVLFLARNRCVSTWLQTRQFRLGRKPIVGVHNIRGKKRTRIFKNANKCTQCHRLPLSYYILHVRLFILVFIRGSFFRCILFFVWLRCVHCTCAFVRCAIMMNQMILVSLAFLVR